MPGYSTHNGGYNEQSAVPWGKVALYGAGAAAGYGVIRAGAIKARNSKMYGQALGAVGTGRAAGRGILGMGRPGGYKSFADLGQSAVGKMLTEGSIKNRARATNTLLQNNRGAGGRFKALSAAQRKGLPSIIDGGAKAAAWAGQEGAKGVAARGAMGALGFFGAYDYKGSSWTTKAGKSVGTGWKRGGVAAARSGLALAAVDFLNPWGFGSLGD